MLNPTSGGGSVKTLYFFVQKALISRKKNQRFGLRLGSASDFSEVCFCRSSVGHIDLLKLLLPFSEANDVLTVYSSSSALRSVIFHPKLRCFS